MVTIHQDGLAEFRFFRPNASRVFVVGDLNHWRTDQLKMHRQPDGYWVLRVSLPAGEYKFRYVADGLWYTDYAAFGVEPGRFGMDSVVRIAAAPATLQLPAAAGQPGQAAAAA